MKAMKVMKKAAIKRRAMKAAAPAAPMKAMKVMKKKAAMKRAMKAAAPMKAMKVMKKKAAMKAMKVMKGKAVKAMPKSGIADALASKTGLEKKAVSGVVDQLVTLATAEVKKTGKFTIPGLCMLKTRIRP